jgi:hypothetical protein
MRKQLKKILLVGIPLLLGSLHSGSSATAEASTANSYVSGSNGWQMKVNWYQNSTYTSSVTTSVNTSDAYSLVVDYSNSSLSSSLSAGKLAFRVYSASETYTGMNLTDYGDTAFFDVTPLTDTNFKGSLVGTTDRYCLEASKKSYSSGSAAEGTIALSLNFASSQMQNYVQYLKDKTYTYKVDMLVNDKVIVTQSVDLVVSRSKRSYTGKITTESVSTTDYLPEGDYIGKSVFQIIQHENAISTNLNGTHGVLNYAYMTTPRQSNVIVNGSCSSGWVRGITDASAYENYATEVTLTSSDSNIVYYYNKVKYTPTNGSVTIKINSCNNSGDLFRGIFAVTTTTSGTITFTGKIRGAYWGYDTYTMEDICSNTFTVTASSHILSANKTLTLAQDANAVNVEANVAVQQNEASAVNKTSLLFSYTGTSIDVETYMDTVYATDTTQHILTDSDYTITAAYISESMPTTNGVRETVFHTKQTTSDYNMELYVRYAGASEYTLFLPDTDLTSQTQEGLSRVQGYCIDLSSKKVVAIKYKYYGLNSTITSSGRQVMSFDILLANSYAADSKVYFCWGMSAYKANTTTAMPTTMYKTSDGDSSVLSLVNARDTSLYGSTIYRSIGSVRFLSSLLFIQSYNSISNATSNSETGECTFNFISYPIIHFKQAKNDYIDRIYVCFEIPDGYSVNISDVYMKKPTTTSSTRYVLKDGTSLTYAELPNYFKKELQTKDGKNYVVAYLDFTDNPLNTKSIGKATYYPDIYMCLLLLKKMF